MRLQEETGLFLRSFMYSPAVASVSLTVMLSQMKEKKKATLQFSPLGNK